MMVSNVISWPTCAIAKLNAIAKIRKYRRLHKRHHFIPMAMGVHDALECDMNLFIRECAHLFYDRWLGCHLILSFCIQFFKHRINITFQCALAFHIERKIALAGDACFKPPITIRSHELHVDDNRGAMGEIASYHERTSSLLFFGSCGLLVFWPFFGLPFFHPLWWFQPSIFCWIFVSLLFFDNTSKVFFLKRKPCVIYWSMGCLHPPAGGPLGPGARLRLLCL